MTHPNLEPILADCDRSADLERTSVMGRVAVGISGLCLGAGLAAGLLYGYPLLEKPAQAMAERDADPSRVCHSNPEPDVKFNLKGSKASVVVYGLGEVACVRMERNPKSAGQRGYMRLSRVDPETDEIVWTDGGKFEHWTNWGVALRTGERATFVAEATKPGTQNPEEDTRTRALEVINGEDGAKILPFKVSNDPAEVALQPAAL